MQDPTITLIGELFSALRAILTAHHCICPTCERARAFVRELEAAAADHDANCPCCRKGERI